MPYYKFSEDDVFFNRIKTHPSCHFFSWKGCTYYNNQYVISGAFHSPIGHVGYAVGTYTSSCNSGYINIHEMNVDRHEARHTFDTKQVSAGNWPPFERRSDDKATLVFPFMSKDGTKNALKSVTYDSYVDDFNNGDIISGSYPLTGTITRVFESMIQAGTPCPIDGKIGKEASKLWTKYDFERPDYKAYVKRMEKRKEVEPIINLPQDISTDKKVQWKNPK